LWRDSLDALGISLDGLAQSRAALPRFSYFPDSLRGDDTRDYPLSRIVIMDSPLHARAGLQPLADRAATRGLSGAVSQFHLGRRLSVGTAIRSRLQALVATTETFRLTFRPVFEEMDRTVDLLIERFGS
jgi:hypothetical protein